MRNVRRLSPVSVNVCRLANIHSGGGTIFHWCAKCATPPGKQPESTELSADGWPDDVRLSGLEARFACQACGRRGADVRPNFDWKIEARRARLSGRHTSGLRGL